MPDSDWQRRCEAGLAFFGRVTASTTHDLKNHLATIKEKAGLMGDLLAMAAQGRPLDPARLERLVQDIGHRVNQADEVIRRLNGFAHSVDYPRETLDVGHVLEATLAVCQRLATMKGVTLSGCGVDPPVALETKPFFLRQTIFELLELAMREAGSGGRIQAEVLGGPEGVDIILTLAKSGPAREAPAPPAATSAIELLGGRAAWENADRLRLHLPRTRPDS